jgi:menaquinone-dependent protoporphyrinogen oxidase
MAAARRAAKLEVMKGDRRPAYRDRHAWLLASTAIQKGVNVMNASTQLLVAYATKHGSTQEVAESIAETLAASGHDVDVRAAADVRDLGGYDGVILGGALYMGRWHGDAIGFLERHRLALATIPIAVFAMGPQTLADADVASSRAQLDKALAKVPDVSPSAVAIFGGVVDPTTLRFPLSRMRASDARDWQAIAAWANDVAEIFTGTAARERVAGFEPSKPSLPSTKPAAYVKTLK